jgi:hypothetical protein
MSTGPGSKQYQKGPEPFAPCIDNVARDLVDQGNLAVKALFYDPVDGVKIGGNEPTYLF